MNKELRNINKSSNKTIIHNSKFIIQGKKGFTLIELLVVIAVIGILAVGGFVSFISYTQKVTLDNATSDVVNMLNTAKSRAQAQIKPNGSSFGTPTTTFCSTSSNTFWGYKVSIVRTNGNYNLSAVCDGDKDINTNCCTATPSCLKDTIDGKTLPSSLRFTNDLDSTPSEQCLFFKAGTGSVVSGSNKSIYIYSSSNSQVKTINVDAAGNISTN